MVKKSLYRLTQHSLVKNSLIYVVLGFLPLAINFFLAPVYSKYISPGEFGLVALAAIFQAFLVVFITLGLDGAFSRIYFDYHKKEKLVRALMSTTLLTIIVCGGIVWTFLYFFGDHLFRLFLQNEKFTFSDYGYLVFFTTFSTAVHAVFLIYYRNKEKVLIYSLVSLSFFLASVGGILYGVVYLRAEAIGNIAGRAVGTSVVAAILLFLFFFRNGVRFKLEYLKNSLIYSLPLVPYVLFLMAYTNIDKIMIEQYFDLKILGLYNFAFLLASVVSVLIFAVFNAVSPRIYSLLTEGGVEKIRQAGKINVVFHLLITGLVASAIAGIIPVLKIFISEQYQPIRDYIPLLILVYIFQVYYAIYTLPLFFHKKTNIMPLISLFVLIVAIISNVIFIPVFGIYGVCLALFVTKLSQFLFAYLFVRHYGYNSQKYLLLSKNHLISGLVIFSYGAVFFLSYSGRFSTPEILNFIPLLVFILAVAFLFGKNLSSYGQVIRKSIR